MLFSILLITVFGLLRASIPADPREQGGWLATSSTRVELALNLVPLSGIAFLWFIGVLRDRLGRAEDRFFATVFLGSGLLFLAMLFIAAGVIGAILIAFATEPSELTNSAAFAFARAAVYNIVNVYMLKMACVFMITTSTVAVYTRIVPRWLAFGGYALSLVVLLGSYYSSWCFVVFPVWVFLLSFCILWDNYRRPSASAVKSGSVEMDASTTAKPTAPQAQEENRKTPTADREPISISNPVPEGS
jgi:hypothetical protein